MKKLMITAALFVGVGAVGAGVVANTNLLTKAQDLTMKVQANEAEQIAKKLFDGTIVEFEYDNDLPVPHYEMELMNDNEKVTIEVNALTGNGKIKERTAWTSATTASPVPQVTEPQQNTETANTASASPTTNTVNLTMEEAKKIALQQAPGTVTSAELDEFVYEFDIQNGLYEYEVDINATTGAVIKVERELDND